jgi:hypothetical protein
MHPRASSGRTTPDRPLHSQGLFAAPLSAPTGPDCPAAGAEEPTGLGSMLHTVRIHNDGAQETSYVHVQPLWPLPSPGPRPLGGRRAGQVRRFHDGSILATQEGPRRPWFEPSAPGAGDTLPVFWALGEAYGKVMNPCTLIRFASV